MSAVPQQRGTDMVAGFLAAFSLALSAVAVVRTPGLLAPVAILVALVAARMSEAHRVLAGWAVGLSTVAFFAGMLVAIATDNPIF